MNTIKTGLIIVTAFVSLSASAQKVLYLGQLQGENHQQKNCPTYQGMDIYGNYLVSLQDKGTATIYKLSRREVKKISQFHLASYDLVNHANVMSFGIEKYDKNDPLPLAYVSQCHKKPYNGLKDVLFVERIAPDLKSSELVQTIYYNDRDKDFGYALQWVIDTKNKLLYGYGNTIDNSNPANRHRIIKFRLPRLEEGVMVTLRPEDALENYTIEEVSDFRFNPIGQGLYVYKDKLYMPTGVGRYETPSILYVWDLVGKNMEVVDLTRCTAGELEDIGRYKGHLVIQGQEGLFLIKRLK